LFTSDVIPVSIAAGASLELLSPTVISATQLREISKPGSRLQVFFSVQEVQFANSAVWRITPNPAAHDSREALGFARAAIPRELIGVRPPQSSSICLDQNRKRFSQGAVVGILNEPGAFAKCNLGGWEETTGR